MDNVGVAGQGRAGQGEQCNHTLKPPLPPPPPPTYHRRDTSLRVEKPKHDKGCENAAHVRVLEASGHENVGGLCTHGVVLKRYAPHTVQQ